MVSGYPCSEVNESHDLPGNMPFAASGGISKRIIGIDAIILQFSIKRRAPYAEFPCDLAHLPAIETKGETDKLFLDLSQFSDIA